MLGAVLTGAAITVAALLLGQAVMALSGRERPSPVAPAAGVSALLVICGIAVKLPGHALSAAIAAAVAVAAAAWVLSRAPQDQRRAIQIPAGPLIVFAAAALVTAIPFLASGRMGILGQGLVNDDMASHLLFAEWIDTRTGDTPDLIADGYPLGPHALVAAAAEVTGANLIEAFAGLTGAIAVLTALTAYGVLAGVRFPLRVPVAVLVAFPYLGAAYLAQGAFKEPLLALALLGFALSLPPLRRSSLVSRRPRGERPETRDLALDAVPAGTIAAGTIYNYSFPGLAWLVVAGGLWALVVALRERRRRGGLDLADRLRASRPALAVGVAVPALAALPELVRLLSFTDFEAFDPGGTGGRVGLGNLRQALNPIEALGIWPSTEFRIAPENATTPEIAFYLGAILGLAALAWGVGRALSRHEAVLPAALAAAILGYLAALAYGTPYTQAKALAIVSPLVMLVALRGLLSAAPVEGEEEDAARAAVEAGEGRMGRLTAWAGWRPGASGASLARLGVPVLAAAFALAAAFSSLLPLRQAAIGPQAQVAELVGLRPWVEGEDVLFLGRESFAAWELLGAHVHAPIVHHYNVEEVPSLYRATSQQAKFDFDVVPPSILERFPFVIATRAAQRSDPPAGFESVAETPTYVLWERHAPLGERRTLPEPAGPGATVGCSGSEDRALTALDGTATIFGRLPVVGRAWEPTENVTDSQPASEELLLEPGRWSISLQYASTQEMRIRGPGLDVTLEPNLLFRGPAPYYPVGELVVRERGPAHFTVSVSRPPLAGRLLGAETRAYLGPLAATPAEPRQRLPLADACGAYVDWYEADPQTSDAALARVPAPRQREVVEN